MASKRTKRLTDEIWLCQRNIERFLKQLNEEEDDPEKQDMLRDLIAKEEAKLLHLNSDEGAGV